MAFSFSVGAYMIAAVNSPDGKAAHVAVAAIQEALKDTSRQPIIHIIPESSLYEKAKGVFGFTTEREIVVISTSEVEMFLGLKKAEEAEEDGMIKAGFDVTTQTLKNGWNWTSTHVSNGWNWVREKF